MLDPTDPVFPGLVLYLDPRVLLRPENGARIRVNLREREDPRVALKKRPFLALEVEAGSVLCVPLFSSGGGADRRPVWSLYKAGGGERDGWAGAAVPDSYYSVFQYWRIPEPVFREAARADLTPYACAKTYALGHPEILAEIRSDQARSDTPFHPLVADDGSCA